MRLLRNRIAANLSQGVAALRIVSMSIASSSCTVKLFDLSAESTAAGSKNEKIALPGGCVTFTR